MKIDTKKIHPKNGTKYSKNLHAWLLRHANYNEVFRHDDGTLFVGMVDDESWFYGARLISVLCNGKKEDTAAYDGLSRYLSRVPDFWARYFAVGRCAIDPDHKMSFLNDEERWDNHGTTRTCRWCGIDQIRRDWTEMVHKSEWLTTSKYGNKIQASAVHGGDK